MTLILLIWAFPSAFLAPARNPPELTSVAESNAVRSSKHPVRRSRT
jgi:hypothetical protein